MNFWIIFGLLGLIFIPVGSIFIIGGVDKAHKIGGTVVVIILWFLMSFGIWSQNAANTKTWNDGFCECGTHWELTAVSEYRASVTKYYTCPDCHSEIKINY